MLIFGVFWLISTLRKINKRQWNGVVGSKNDGISMFNQFIIEMELEDVPKVGREFSWYRPNVKAKSLLNRFLVQKEWFNIWSGSIQFILDRNISDHCPIVLKDANVDLGPKPFRSLDYWFQHENYVEVVEGAWRNMSIHRWGAYVLKEKLKGLKKVLREWNATCFGDFHSSQKEIALKMNELDKLEEARVLVESELNMKIDLKEQFWILARRNESFLRQKSRSRWLVEGDNNSIFFHGTINWRRRKNLHRGLHIDGI